MASEISILRKFFSNIHNNLFNDSNINTEYSFRTKYYKQDVDTIGSSFISLQLMNYSYYHGTILKFYPTNKILVINAYEKSKRYNNVSIEDFISSTDEELVLIYGRDILNDKILDEIKIYIPIIEKSLLNHYLGL